MTTFVGTQSNFVDAIKDLIELEYDAVEAYEAALNRLEAIEYKEKLSQFESDHNRHIQALTRLLENHNEQAPTGPSLAKQWITKGKVVLANLGGDHAILNAMNSNETDTNTAYERMQARDDKWQDAVEIIRQALEDERRHKAWFESILS